MNANYFFNQSTKKNIFIIVIIPILFQLLIVNLVRICYESSILYYLLFFLFWLLFLPFFYWLKIMVTYLYNIPNDYFNFKLKYFKISLFVNAITFLNFVFCLAYIFSFVFKGSKPNIDVVVYFFGFHAFGMIFFIYNGYFISKLFATLELKRKVNYIDTINYKGFLSIRLIAVWSIHKKGKKFFLENYKVQNESKQ